MLARHHFDITWSAFAAGLWGCLTARNPEAIARRLEAAWSLEPDDAFACLAIRSGFDLLLQALALPRGAEVLVSAVTIRNMVDILEHHGLVPVPVDLDTARLALDVEALEAAVTPRTRAVLVAHLFGSRMPMDAVVAWAHGRGLLVFEDCAQAFVGPTFRGHPGADVSMFSFGSIKTTTALGGGLLRVRDAAVRGRMRELQSAYPRQTRGYFFKRVFKYMALHAFSHPLPYGAFVAACRRRGKDYDRIINLSTKGFPPGEGFFAAIRQQPSTPLLALLERRIRRYDPRSVGRRTDFRELAKAQLPPQVEHPGFAAEEHAHWIFPVLVGNPEAVMAALTEAGFDATQGATSLAAVGRPEAAPAAHRMMRQVIYVPLHPGMSEGALHRMMQVLGDTAVAPAHREAAALAAEPA